MKEGLPKFTLDFSKTEGEVKDSSIDTRKHNK
jgi:hypothetical protein